MVERKTFALNGNFLSILMSESGPSFDKISKNPREMKSCSAQKPFFERVINDSLFKKFKR